MQRFNAAEKALIDVWEAHTAAEFEHKDADEAIATMTEHPVLIHVPVGTGATGREALRKIELSTSSFFGSHTRFKWTGSRQG